MIYPHKLSDPESAKVLEGLDVAESGHGVEQLDWRGRQPWNPGPQEIEELPVLGVHDGSLDELHHRLTAILKLGMAPQAEGSSVVLHSSVVGDALGPEAEAQDVPRVRAVPHQERAVRLPFQLHLCVFPIHRPPVPTTLLQLAEAGREAARVLPVKGTLQVLGGLAVQGLGGSDGSDPGKSI